jgi:hypothetical protein
MADSNKNKKGESHVREGQDDSSIHHDKKKKDDLPYPVKEEAHSKYKQQDEFAEKTGTRKEDDEV